MRIEAEYVDFCYQDYCAGFPSEGADYTGIGAGFTVEDAINDALDFLCQSVDDPDNIDWDALERDCFEQLASELGYPDAETLGRELGFEDTDDDCPSHYVGIRLWL